MIQAAGCPRAGVRARPNALVVLVKTNRLDLGRDGLLEQVQRAGDVRLDEVHAPVRPHVRLVQRRGVHDRVHAGHASLHGLAVDDRPDHRRRRRREHVKAGDLVALVAQHARQSFAQMSGAAGDENPHVLIHIRPA